jgi:hypothetical protein
MVPTSLLSVMMASVVNLHALNSGRFALVFRFRLIVADGRVFVAR